ncbi:hypothetical protein PMZ80_006322 [Knufia obscura]|uniref:Integral membrane protein n=1 Tax=Knufia obscura TaxID=1635080 RepID=A0ABR0RLA7_9EURO|nr:hypothetical protein PMZ80_006322 [Knufia obscura]
METPTPGPGSNRNSDYFTPTPLQYQVRTRPIGIRRLPSSTDVESTDMQRTRSNSGLRRRRTNTGPRDQPSDNPTAGLAALPGHYEIGNPTPMGTIREGQEAHHGENPNQGKKPHRESMGSEGGIGRSGSTRLRGVSNVARSVLSKMSDDPDEGNLRRGRAQTGNGRDYESDVVDYLDVLDPEVSTLTTLNNVQNSLFVPDIPFFNRYYNRRPTYELSRGPSRDPTRARESHEPASLRPQVSRQITRQLSRQLSRKPTPPTPEPPQVPPKPYTQEQRAQGRGTPEPFSTPGMSSTDDLNRRLSITSHVEDEHYAVLPHGVSLEGWSQEDVDVLDDYVRHMLHSRRSRFKRSMKGFGKYIRKPLGFFVTLYAFLITAFGLIWVLFLIGWISLPGKRKDYIIHIVDSVLVGLFAIMGDGLAPFRCVDTYHMIYIAHYHRLSWKLRKAKNLPKLADHNDLPERSQKEVCADAEAGVLTKGDDADWEFSVLSPEQQRKLVHHQNKFSKSHSYYRPHETTTHHAFPLKLLITIVSLLDAHSVLQISLGAFTWGWSYHTRPEWITAVILSLSITCNITGGVLISVGDKRTRKKDVLLRMARQGLTEEAMRKVEQKKREEGAEEEAERIKQSVDMARLANVRHGVRSPSPVGSDGESAGEFEKGTEEIKEKVRAYKNISHDVGGEEDGIGNGSERGKLGVPMGEEGRGKSWRGEGSSEVGLEGYRTASEERPGEK